MSSDNTTFFETEIAAPARSGRTDDDVIYQLELEDSAGLENSASKPHISLTRRSVAGWMVMHHDEGIRGVRDHGFKDFSWVAERFIDAALANRADLNEVLLGVEKNNAQGFTIEKAHFGTEIGDRKRTIDRERLTLLAQCDGAHPKRANQPQSFKL